MTVFYQAVLDGRLSKDECRTRPSKRTAGKTVYSVTARALRAIKREEAEVRNEDTPLPNRKRYRRELAAGLAEAAAKRRKDRA